MPGPGKDFRKGITLNQIFKKFPDDAAAERYFIEERWPDGPHCPHCGSTNVLSGAKHPTMPFLCREKQCRKRFSVRTKGVMEASNLGYQAWIVAIYLVMTSLKSVSAMKLHRDLGITHKSAWFLAHRIREAYQEIPDPFLGPVEVDETFMGGKRRNMSSKKRKMSPKTGTGGKTIVVGIKDRRTNKVSAAMIEGRDAKTLHTFIEDHVSPDATVYSDDYAGYVGMVFDHGTVRHSAGEYVAGDDGSTSTQGIESFWAMLKRAHKGTFHKISPKHMDRYVTEFTGRHNMRGLDTEDQMKELLAGMAGRRLRYPDLISDNGLDSMARG